MAYFFLSKKDNYFNFKNSARIFSTVYISYPLKTRYMNTGAK